jgi:hypothetical protein
MILPIEYFCLYFELLALMAVLYRRFVVRDRTLTIFAILLVLTVIVEWGNALKLFTPQQKNHWVFNLFNPIQFGLYTIIFYRALQQVTTKKSVVIFYGVYLLLSLLNTLFMQGLKSFSTYTFMFGCIMVVCFVYLYLRQAIQNPQVESLTKQRMFWICVGLLVFHTGDFLLMAFMNYFIRVEDIPSFRPVFYGLINPLNIVQYTCLTIAFFCKPTTPHTS